jgi:repressor LexA
MAMNKLTPRQSQILSLIQDNIRNSGYPPTRAEIATEMGFRSPNAAEEHLRALETKGAIELLPGISRGIRVISKARRRGLPVVARTSAGDPMLTQENIDDYYQIDPGVFQPRADFFLRVKGMSMRDAGIVDGDLVAVHATSTAESGQVVVARLDDEVTIKRFRQRGNRVRLMPENPAFPPILVEPREQSLIIEGVVVGVLRPSAP